ncbi:helicase domain protein, partial [Vibrio parahaemolyticus V-223/04]
TFVSREQYPPVTTQNAVGVFRACESDRG